ncbi:MAG TPA: hypothetical protein PKL15_17620 [Saprospiraceae bacterium]|nr:hypothetical protein [Saprospiraceae bacterium]HNM27269.1 hypothetical protein [Saprospiraceae bacterium]
MNLGPFRWAALLLFLPACTTTIEPADNLPVVSFQSDISPILSANCALADGCHGASGGEFPLVTHDQVLRYAKPGNPYDSELYQSVRKYAGEGAMPPKPNTPLSDQQIGQIYLWILQGANDN